VSVSRVFVCSLVIVSSSAILLPYPVYNLLFFRRVMGPGRVRPRVSHHCRPVHAPRAHRLLLCRFVSSPPVFSSDRITALVAPARQGAYLNNMVARARTSTTKEEEELGFEGESEGVCVFVGMGVSTGEGGNGGIFIGNSVMES
jgi:hypothetical protein